MATPVEEFQTAVGVGRSVREGFCPDTLGAADLEKVTRSLKSESP